ncbi:hypothetical protein [Pseudomonas sp. CBC3]|uniref:hypothetical protein n=1 Tax=Pseudomonas sp. CBC3 TaxID=3123318 RepID=UPI0030E94ABE
MKLVRDARTLKTKALCSLRTGMQAFNSFDDDGRITTVLQFMDVKTSDETPFKGVRKEK